MLQLKKINSKQNQYCRFLVYMILPLSPKSTIIFNIYVNSRHGFLCIIIPFFFLTINRKPVWYSCFVHKAKNSWQFATYLRPWRYILLLWKLYFPLHGQAQYEAYWFVTNAFTSYGPSIHLQYSIDEGISLSHLLDSAPATSKDLKSTPSPKPLLNVSNYSENKIKEIGHTWYQFENISRN